MPGRNRASKIQYVPRYAITLMLLTILEVNGNQVVSWQVFSDILNLKGLFCIQYFQAAASNDIMKILQIEWLKFPL